MYLLLERMIEDRTMNRAGRVDEDQLVASGSCCVEGDYATFKPIIGERLRRTEKSSIFFGVLDTF